MFWFQTNQTISFIATTLPLLVPFHQQKSIIVIMSTPPPLPLSAPSPSPPSPPFPSSPTSHFLSSLPADTAHYNTTPSTSPTLTSSSSISSSPSLPSSSHNATVHSHAISPVNSPAIPISSLEVVLHSLPHQDRKSVV